MGASTFRHFFICIILSLINWGITKAQDISFETNVPSLVWIGDSFDLTYTLTGDKGTDFEGPTSIKGFDIKGNVKVSSGKRPIKETAKDTFTVYQSYTYKLFANQNGLFRIPKASIKVNGETYVSKPESVEVVPPSENTNEATFEAEVEYPNSIHVGEEFKLRYILKEVRGTDFKGPTSIDNFDIINGPVKSDNSIRQVINGKTIYNYIETYTYVLMPKDSGWYTMPEATIKIGTKNFRSQPLTIEVKENFFSKPEVINIVSNPDPVDDNTRSSAIILSIVYMLIIIIYFGIGIIVLIKGFRKKKKSLKIAGFIMLGVPISILFLLVFYIFLMMLISPFFA